MKNKKLVINKKHAKVIKQIFNWYLEGYSFYGIADKLTKMNVETFSGETKWAASSISNILSNVKYIGDVQLGKYYTADPITHRMVKNRGERDMYYVKNHHEAIISKEMFKLAQELRNKKYKQNTSGAKTKHNYIFSGMCVCNECGSGMSGVIIKRKVREKGYDCSRYRQYSTKACNCHEIKEKDILIHLKEFLKFTKQKYLKEIKAIKLEQKQDKTNNDKFKLQNKLNILNEEYKMLINQKIKEMASCNNSMQREIIENTYKELEKEKMQSITYLQEAIQNDEKKNLEEKLTKLKTSLEYFDEIINAKEPSRIILQMIIDKIYIHRDKTIRFKLKIDIDKLT